MPDKIRTVKPATRKSTGYFGTVIQNAVRLVNMVDLSNELRQRLTNCKPLILKLR